jgi:hypothetical protein
MLQIEGTQRAGTFLIFAVILFVCLTPLLLHRSNTHPASEYSYPRAYNLPLSSNFAPGLKILST